MSEKEPLTCVSPRITVRRNAEIRCSTTLCPPCLPVCLPVCLPSQGHAGQSGCVPVSPVSIYKTRDTGHAQTPQGTRL